jgi:ABC-2 type transport system permease protein
VSRVTATAGRLLLVRTIASMRMYAALAAAGFRRYATYRQATLAAISTNSVFGFLRCSVLLAVTASAGSVAGYDSRRLATYVWLGQGLIGTVQIWAPPEFAERIRTGDVITDLLRPVPAMAQQLAADLGRCGYALLTRFGGPLLVGLLAFDLYPPARPATYPMFALSVLLATLVSFGCRFMINAAAYWLLDVRGPQAAWTIASTALSGLAFPIWYLPDPVAWALVLGTPLPSLIQLPLDVIVEHGSPARQLELLAIQAGWATALIAGGRWMQRLGERRLVIQGG